MISLEGIWQSDERVDDNAEMYCVLGSFEHGIMNTEKRAQMDEWMRD